MSIIWTLSPALNRNTTGWSGNAARQVASGLLGGAAALRVRFVAATAGNNFKTDHCSIGVKGAATAPSMAATNPNNSAAQPVELKFGGVSGFNIAAGQAITSDWTPLLVLPTDTLVVDWDANSGVSVDAQSNSDSGVFFFKAATAAWNTASVSGFSSGSSSGVNQIEAFDPFRRQTLVYRRI